MVQKITRASTCWICLVCYGRNFCKLRPRSIIYGETGVQSTIWISMRRMLTILLPALPISSSTKALDVFAPCSSWHDFLAMAVLEFIISPSQKLSHHYWCAIRMLRLFCYSQFVERMSRVRVGCNLCEAAFVSYWHAWDLVADAVGYMISDLSHRFIDTKSNLLERCEIPVLV